MYPKCTILEEFGNMFRQRLNFSDVNPNVYGSIEHTFYAYRIYELPYLQDMYYTYNKSELRKRKIIPLDPESKYFIMNTMVGVGSKNNQKISRVHIRFAIWAIDKCIPEVEIIQIYPNYISKTIGQITNYQSRSNEASVEAGAETPNALSYSGVPATATISGKLKMGRSSKKEITGTLPNQIHITKASGITNRAIWEFYRGEGIEDVGQYDLEIIFRIHGKDFEGYDDKLSYCIDWNVEINGRRLYDHDHLFTTGITRPTVNGIEILYSPTDNKQHSKIDSKPGDYWNIDIDECRKKDFTSLLKKETGIDKKNFKLLRPLILKNSSMYNPFSFLNS